MRHPWSRSAASLLLLAFTSGCGGRDAASSDPSSGSHTRGAPSSDDPTEDRLAVFVKLTTDPIANPRGLPPELIEVLEHFEAGDPEPASRYVHPRSGAPLRDVYVYDIPSDKDVASFRGLLQAAPGVVYAELPLRLETHFPLTHQWGHGMIHATPGSAWSLATGEGVVVAVLDTGVDAGHVDLAANIWSNAGEIPGNNNDDDNNGFVDDVTGWNFANGNNITHDANGHGSHVAGIIAAPNNGVGVTGVAYEATIMPVKVLSPWGDQVALADGILYAVDNGADVINISAGGPGYSHLIADAIEYANEHGVAVVVSAGNAAESACEHSPANVEQAITVGAVDNQGNPSFFTNTGNKVEVMAPGGDTTGTYPYDVLSTIPTGVNPTPGDLFEGGGRFTAWAGTSMAAPHVAGAIALMKELHPAWPAEAYRFGMRWGLQPQNLLDAHVMTWYAPPITPGANVLTPRNCARIDNDADVDVVVLNNEYEITLASVLLATGDQGNGNDPVPWTAAYIEAPEFPDGIHELRVQNQNMPAGVPAAWDTNLITIDNDYLTDLPPVLNPPGGLLDIHGRVVDPYLDNWLITWQNLDTGAGASVGVPSSTPKDPEQLLTTLDVSALPDGPYRLELRSHRVGNPNFAPYYNVDTEDFILDRDLVEGFPVRLPATTRLSPKAADLDQDGHVELIVGAAVYEDDGTPKAGWAHTAEAVRAFADSLQVSAVADVDADGELEVVSRFDVVDPNGVFGYTMGIRAYDPDGSVLWSFVPKLPGSNLTAWDERLVSSVTIEDVDGDGALEVVYGAAVTVSSTRIHVIDAGNGVEQSQFKVDGYLYDPYSVPQLAAADLDGDGVREIITSGHKSGNLYVHATNSTGTELTGWPGVIPVTTFRAAKASPLVLDLDGDCELEVLVGGYGFDTDGSAMPDWSFLSREDNAVIQIDPNDELEVAAGWSRVDGLLRLMEHDATVIHGFSQCTGPAPASTVDLGDPVTVQLDNDADPEVLQMSHCNDPSSPLSFAKLLRFDTDGSVSVFKAVPDFDGKMDHLVTSTPLIDDLDGDDDLDIVAVAGDLLYHWQLDVTYEATLSRQFRGDRRNTGHVSELPCFCDVPSTCAVGVGNGGANPN